jgi:hypothetical protein
LKSSPSTPKYTVQISSHLWRDLCFEQTLEKIQKLVEIGAIIGLQVTMVQEISET